jgi:glycosyltransferase involved in cell wall biosynthesis
MTLLWDFRLFSFGYGSRGVGAYTSAMADAIAAKRSGERIIIWGEKKRVPQRFYTLAEKWIEYSPGAWKRDLFTIPFLIVKYRVDIFHYWVALGPLFRIGLGLFHPCKTCLTVHDCGVEFWDKTPMCVSTKKTRYWKIQKLLFPRADRIVCNSFATQTDINRLFKGNTPQSIVLYPPLEHHESNRKIKREKRFIILNGDAHKNIQGVIEGLQQFRQRHPDYSLVVLGENNDKTTQVPGVTFEGMEAYQEYLQNSAGLIVCSFYEGLGLPVLEAMERDCPIVLSDIPVFREICPESGIFVNPYGKASIARGMEECASHGEEWERRFAQDVVRYKKLSALAGEKLLTIYRDLMENSEGIEG